MTPPNALVVPLGKSLPSAAWRWPWYTSGRTGVCRGSPSAGGAKRCERCRATEAKAAVPRLLDVCPEGDFARPTVTVVRDGKPDVRVFDVLRSFADEAEARAFAESHGIEDVDLAGR